MRSYIVMWYDIGVDVMQKKKENTDQGSSDEEFILWLYQEFYRLMFFTAQKYVSDQTQQEEIVQESLRKLIEKTNHLRHFQRPVLASYIVSTVRNTSIDLLKSLQEEENRIVNLDDLLTQEFSESRAVEEGLILREETEQFKKIWKELDAETRMVLEGKYILGYNSEKLSQLLKCKPNSVRMRLTRARRKALELMRRKGYSHD